MTKSTITRERIQRIIRAIDSESYDEEEIREWLSSDEIMELSRMALTAMDSESVFTLEVARADYKGQKLGNHFGFITLDAARELKEGNYQLYAAQPAPVVEREPIAWLNDAYLARGVVDGEAGSEDAGPGYIPVYREAGPQPAPVVPDEKPMPNPLSMYAVDAVAAIAEVRGWNACRAAMLAAAPQPQNAPQNIPEIIPDCWCRTCRPVVLNDMRFVVCPDCGNKRCPRANDHRNACTGSNEPGQEGSAYPDAQQEVKGE
ncbi:hypothetical protein ACYB48_08565 [Klebsiella pneumoniae]